MTSDNLIPVLAHLIVALAFILRILYRKLEVNTALAWIVVLIVMPIAGPILYILFGEHSLGSRRLKVGRLLRGIYRDTYAAPSRAAAQVCAPQPFDALARSIAAESGFPILVRNAYTILTDAGEILDRMRQDIDAAQSVCRLEFYIIDPSGRVEVVLEALLRAAARGVSCQILADDFGSKPFFRSRWPKRLEAAGVTVVRSLSGGVFKSLSKRSDLRNHRKLLICDRLVAYTGSFNLIDPALFKAKRKIGQWIDVMMRLEGEVVDALDCVFNADLLFDGSRSITAEALPPLPSDPPDGAWTRMNAPMQVLPSGPEMAQSTIYQFIVTAIFLARRRVRIVTPYFIPDQAVLMALTSAARFGVKIQIIVPERLDTRIGQYASQASYDALLAAGVEIRRFSGGLLHTKAVLVDDDISVFGTANMDPRSFYLNLELSLIIYEPGFNSALDRILDTYVSRSEAVDRPLWLSRSRTQRFLENLMRLAAPLL